MLGRHLTLFEQTLWSEASYQQKKSIDAPEMPGGIQSQPLTPALEISLFPETWKDMLTNSPFSYSILIVPSIIFIFFL